MKTWSCIVVCRSLSTHVHCRASCVCKKTTIRPMISASRHYHGSSFQTLVAANAVVIDGIRGKQPQVSNTKQLMGKYRYAQAVHLRLLLIGFFFILLASLRTQNKSLQSLIAIRVFHLASWWHKHDISYVLLDSHTESCFTVFSARSAKSANKSL